MKHLNPDFHFVKLSFYVWGIYYSFCDTIEHIKKKDTADSPFDLTYHPERLVYYNNIHYKPHLLSFYR